MTVSAINREINGYIEELRLSAMKECYEEYALKAENEKDNYKEYLLAQVRQKKLKSPSISASIKKIRHY